MASGAIFASFIRSISEFSSYSDQIVNMGPVSHRNAGGVSVRLCIGKT